MSSRGEFAFSAAGDRLAGQEEAAVAWGDQKDELAFEAATDEKISVKISRAGAVLVNPDKPIPPLVAGKQARNRSGLSCSSGA